MTPNQCHQEYLALTREAMRGPQADKGSPTTEQGGVKHVNHDGVLSDTTPESLLWRAEFYTDQALAAGSGFPLARLVKGQVLVLRGQFQVSTPCLECCLFMKEA